MTASFTAPQPAAAQAKTWRPSLVGKLFAFTPLWVLLAVKFGTRGLGTPMHVAEVGAIPLDLLVPGLALLWMLIGAYALWGVRSLLHELLVFLVFTLPATAALVFGPALVLILQNLG